MISKVVLNFAYMKSENRSHNLQRIPEMFYVNMESSSINSSCTFLYTAKCTLTLTEQYIISFQMLCFLLLVSISSFFYSWILFVKIKNFTSNMQTS
jgi:hypothetical protein